MVIQKGTFVRIASMGNLRGHLTLNLWLAWSSCSFKCSQTFMALCPCAASMDTLIGSHISMTIPVSLLYTSSPKSQTSLKLTASLRHGPRMLPDNGLGFCVMIKGGEYISSDFDNFLTEVGI